MNGQLNDLPVWARVMVEARDYQIKQQEAEIERLQARISQLYREGKSQFLDARDHKENERLREALAKYADPNYNGYNGGPEHARAALDLPVMDINNDVAD